MTEGLEDTAFYRADNLPPHTGRKRAWLTVIAGSEAGRVYPVEAGQIWIGRSRDADVVLPEKEVSRFHSLLILHADGTATIRDGGSKNGTLLGSRTITETPAPLRDGAKLQVGGGVVLRFSFRDHLEEHFERKLYDSATRDDLTGAFNKRHFDEHLGQELAAASRSRRALSLILIDLDDFKRVNDTCGHAAGDHVLREATARLEGELRESEILARYGGEEFVILLRDSDLSRGLRVAERLRRELHSKPIDWEGKQLTLSASFGVACDPDGRYKDTPERLFQDADDCLYRAKRAGKNRVCGASRPL